MSGGTLKKCFIELRALPLEQFRLPTDGRKWKEIARSRRMVLEFIASFADGDGTVGKFSPSIEKQSKHNGFSKPWVLHIHDDLKQLGFLEWTRDRKSNRNQRRYYTIMLPVEAPGSEGSRSTLEFTCTKSTPEFTQQVNYSSEQVNSRVYPAGKVQSLPIRLLPSKESVSLPSPFDETMDVLVPAQKRNPQNEQTSVSGRGQNVGALGAAFTEITDKLLHATKDQRQFLQRQIENLGFEAAKAVVKEFAEDERHDWGKLHCPAAILQRDWPSYEALVKRQQADADEQAKVQELLKRAESQGNEEWERNMAKIKAEREWMQFGGPMPEHLKADPVARAAAEARWS
jgi:hypothetical protein